MKPPRPWRLNAAILILLNRRFIVHATFFCAFWLISQARETTERLKTNELYSLRVCPKQQSKQSISRVSAVVGLLFAGQALFSLALQSCCTVCPGTLTSKCTGRTTGVCSFSQTALHIYSCLTLNWNGLWKNCISQEREIFHPVLKLPWCFCMQGSHRPVWCNRRHFWQQTIPVPLPPLTFLHFYISTFDTFFALFFFLQTKHSHVISCSSIVLMDVLPTKTLGFRWLFLCDCNGL